VSRWLAMVALASCAAPTGAAQRWPPPLGLSVAAAVVADLDGDGALDLVVAATGATPASEGLYLVRGDVDSDGATIASFTRFAPHPLGAPCALAVVDGALALASTAKGKPTLERLDPATLATLATTPLAIASTTRLALAAAGVHVVILGDDAVVIDSDPPLASPSGAKWPAPQAAIGFGANQLAVATPAQVFTTTLGGAAPYATVRPATDAAPLTAQIATALVDAGGVPITAIVGVDIAGARLCAIDVRAAIGAACIAIPPGDPVGQLVALPGRGVAIVRGAAIASYGNLVLDGARLTADGPLAALSGSLPVASPIVTAVAGHLIALGIDGATACLGPGC